MVKVKICGITNSDDALAAVDYGADAIGFVFYRKSPRFVEPDRVLEIMKALPPFIKTVGVFVNERPEEVRKILELTGIDIVQLHGTEPQKECELWPRVIKSFRVREFTDLELLEKYKVAAYLLDTYTADSYGGTGQIFNWDIAVDAKHFGRVILAGGLTPDNIEKAVRFARPYAVDVSSGVEEKKGKKDHRKLRIFIENAKRALV